MKHTEYKCKCNRAGCMFCDGGLFSCAICGGFEGSLPTDCPSEKMTMERREEIYAGKIDYRDGRGWVKPDGTGHSMGDMDVRYPRLRA